MRFFFYKVRECAEERHGIILNEEERAPAACLFSDYIHELYKLKGKKVVVLIDDYDSPIQSSLSSDQPRLANDCECLFEEFYRVIKSATAMIHFRYLTGITPFLLDGMTGLNELYDVDRLPGSPCSTLFGYTEDEIEHYFSEHLEELSLKEGLSRDEVKSKLDFLYNGYNWHRDRSDCCRVLNPFSVNCLMAFSNV